jgi:hypothetical protein
MMPVSIHALIACPTCHARLDESCRTPSGHTTTAHGSRLASRRCPCGAALGYRRSLCDDCRDERLRASKRAYLRRRRRRLREEASDGLVPSR